MRGVHRALVGVLAVLCFFLMVSPASAGNTSSSNVDWSEDYVEVESELHDPADKGTHSAFVNMQALDQTNDTLTEANQGGAGGSEWISTNAFDSTYNTFDITVGDSPWLGAQDEPNHYRGELSSADASLGWFDFPATTLSGTITVNISCYTRNEDGAGDDWLDVWVDYTGSGAGSDVGDVGQHIGWSYDTIALSTHTVAEVNNLRVYFVYKKSGGGDDVLIDHCRIGLSVAGGDDYELDLEVGWTVDTDYDETVEQLCIFAGPQDAEALKVDVWDGSWTNVISDLIADQWNNVSITSYLTSNAFEIRFIDADQSSDGSQGTWEIDAVLIRVYSYAYKREDNEAMGLSDVETVGVGYSRDYNEAFALSEVESFAIGFARAYDESINLSETYSRALTLVRTFDESMEISEIVVPAANFAIVLMEALGLAALLSTQKAVVKSMNEAFGLSEISSTAIGYGRLFGESITIAAVISFKKDLVKSLFESITVVATIETTKTGGGTAYQKFLDEQFDLSDVVNNAVGFAKALQDALGLSETITNVKGYHKDLGESILIAAVQSNVIDYGRLLGEAIIVSHSNPFPTTIEVTTGHGGFLPPKEKVPIPTENIIYFFLMFIGSVVGAYIIIFGAGPYEGLDGSQVKWFYGKVKYIGGQIVKERSKKSKTKKVKKKVRRKSKWDFARRRIWNFKRLRKWNFGRKKQWSKKKKREKPWMSKKKKRLRDL